MDVKDTCPDCEYVEKQVVGNLNNQRLRVHQVYTE